MKLMLLEQQNKKRLLMARQEQDSMMRLDIETEQKYDTSKMYLRPDFSERETGRRDDRRFEKRDVERRPEWTGRERDVFERPVMMGMQPGAMQPRAQGGMQPYGQMSSQVQQQVMQQQQQNQQQHQLMQLQQRQQQQLQFNADHPQTLAQPQQQDIGRQKMIQQGDFLGVPPQQMQQMNPQQSQQLIAAKQNQAQANSHGPRSGPSGSGERLLTFCQTVSRDETATEDSKIFFHVKMVLEPHIHNAQVRKI
jgi:hypothetical protein